MDRASDAALCVLVSQGDLNALATIYDRHIAVVWTAALRHSTSAAAAEQAVSAAFLDVWRSPEADGEVSLLARLLSNVVHAARNFQQVERGHAMSTNADPRRKRSILAVANDAIDRLHRSLDVADSDFFCECGHVACKERTTLTRAEFAIARYESLPLIVTAHADREDTSEKELHELRGQVHSLKGTLASRVNVEQAKGILAERHGIAPEDAFLTLRDRARNQRRSLDEVCAEIVAGAARFDAGRAFENVSRDLPQEKR